ncbi:MAG: hypothetical protein KBB52_06480 [Candidatus Omnitrophica bacterium]|nr:hypothetical protein [Candidatus Omnitrophota bacterium]
MKVLIVVRCSPAQRFLVTLKTKKLSEEVMTLLRKNRRSQAIAKALSRGIFEREVGCDELPGVGVDLIISEDGASWDFMTKAGVTANCNL